MKLEDITKTLKVGVVGYSGQKFNTDEAKKLIQQGMEKLVRAHAHTHVDVVSGLTNLGIPALSYEYALEKRYMTTGIACSKAVEYECFPVDTKIIIGENWGDESEVFLRHIDCLLRVGGGKQSLEETKTFKELKPDALVVEFELEVEKGNG